MFALLVTLLAATFSFVLSFNFTRIPYNGVKENFIISKYPPSFESIWNFVWENDVNIIVQLHKDEHKINDYNLNVGEKKSVGENLLDLKKTHVEGGVIERIYKISDSTLHQSRIVRHFYIDWPDFGVPDEFVFLNLIHKYEKATKMVNNPIVLIHCKGGQGRSGTFLLVAILHQLPHEDPKIVLKKLRDYRYLVETDEQEVFAHKMSIKLSASEQNSVFNDQIDHIL
jgi:protein tyrosine phosphatase